MIDRMKDSRARASFLLLPILLGAVALSSLGSLGCKRYFQRKSAEQDGAAPLSTAMLIEKPSSFGTTELGYVKVGGDFGGVDYLWVQQGGAISFDVRSAPGAAIDIGGTKLTIGPSGTATYRADLLQRLMDATTETLEGQGITQSTVVTLQSSVKTGATETKGVVTLDLSGYLKKGSRLLLKSVEAGRPLEGRVDSKVARRNLLFLPGLGDNVDHFGRAGRLKDVDLVAVETHAVPRANGTCGPYKGSKSSESSTSPRAEVDSEIVVYSARDGSVVTKRSFSSAKESCPSFAFGKKGEAVKVYPSSGEIKAWLRGVAEGKK